MKLSAWQVLGIAQTTNKKLIKRAYAKLLKLHKPEQDPEGYQHLRNAYDKAIAYCKGENVNSAEDFHKDVFALDLPVKPSHRSEFQYSEPDIENMESVIDDSSDTSVFNDVNNAVQNIFSIESPIESLKSFKTLLKSDLLLNIKNRKLFSLLSIEKGINWDGDFEYPYVLLNDMATELAWFDINAEYESVSDEDIHYLQLRIKAGLEYQALVKLSKQRAFFSKDSSDIRAARLILGEYRPGYFNFQAFIHFNHSFNAIKKIIDKFTQQYSLELCPQINTPSFRWWQKRLNRHAYSIIDVIIATSIVVVLIMLNDISIISIYSLSLDHSIVTGFSILLMVVLSIAVWWMINVLLKGFRFTASKVKEYYKVLKDYISEYWNSIKHRPFVYYGVTSIYIFVFLLAGYLKDSNYDTGLLFLGSILLFIMLEAKIILLCIAYLPYVLVKSEIEFIELPLILNYIFVFVALLSIVSFEKLQEIQLAEWATRSTLGVILSMSIVTSLVSFVLFKSLNYIILF